MSWTANEERYQAEYRGETKYDRPDPCTPDHGQYPVCEGCEAAIAEIEWAARLLCPVCREFEREQARLAVMARALDIIFTGVRGERR